MSAFLRQFKPCMFPGSNIRGEVHSAINSMYLLVFIFVV